jgi:hypothetical protein
MRKIKFRKEHLSIDDRQCLAQSFTNVYFIQNMPLKKHQLQK